MLLAAWAAGRRLLAHVWPGGRQTSTATFTILGLGLGAIVSIVFVLGTVGWLSRPLLTVLLAAGAITGTLDLGPILFRWLRTAPTVRFGSLEVLVVVVPLLPGFAYATLPPTFYDALVYHLGLPNLYLASGSLLHPESFSLAGYPQNAELILTLALAVGNEVAANLTSFALTVLAALLLRRLVLDRYGRIAGNLAYLLLVSQWFFSFQAAFLKVDLVGAFFLLAGFAVVLDTKPQAGARPWIVAGVLAGLAAGVKFANLMPIGLAAVSLPWIVGTTRRWRLGALFLAVALAVSSPWMIRNAVYRGNPMFPAFYQQLGGTGWNDANAARMRSETGMNVDRSIGASAKRIATIGWGGGHGSGGQDLQAWMPLLLVGLALSRRRDTRWLLGLSALGLILGVTFFSKYLRVYCWALMLVPLAGAVLWDRFRHPAARTVVSLVLAGIAVYGLLASAVGLELVSGGGGRVLRGEIGPQDYLVDRLNYTPVARYIDETLDSSARIRMIGSARTAYIHRTCIASYVWDNPFAARLADDEASTREAIEELREAGFTHVLLDVGEMDRLERSQGLFGYSAVEGGRGGIDRFLRALEMEVEANGVYLFRVPEAGAPD